MSITQDPLRWWLAAGMLLSYGLLCAAIGRGQLRKRRAAAALESRQGQPDWIVAFASQTGTAALLAAQTVAALRLAGVSVHSCSLAQLTSAEVARAQRILFLVSTYGEGDAPDDAAHFFSRLLRDENALGGLHYGVLALGDSSYKHYCGFGRLLDQGLQRRGAQALFPLIEVDRGAAPAIEQWRRHLSHLAGSSEIPDWSGPAFADWTLVERRLLNPGSAGLPLFHLALQPANGGAAHWQSGDLAQILAPDAPDCPREYSIASIPQDGSVHLLVRLQRKTDGSPGLASGWLTLEAAPGTRIKMRLCAHQRFQLGKNSARPLILIGNGSGIAGLRSHIKQRARDPQAPVWLLFGERNAASDFPYRQEIERWQDDGVLRRVDLVFSRDQPARRYVQDRLAECHQEVREWIEQGAAIYVCGSLKGMAPAVDQTLQQILGRQQMEMLTAAGRYRRDVY